MSAMTVNAVLAYLERRGSKRNVEGKARYGIVTKSDVGRQGCAEGHHETDGASKGETAVTEAVMTAVVR